MSERNWGRTTRRRQTRRVARSERNLFEDVIDVALPWAVVALEQIVGDRLARIDKFLQRVDVDRLVAALAVEPLSPNKTLPRDGQCFAGNLANCSPAQLGREGLPRYIIAQLLALLRRPVLDELPGLIERLLIIKQPNPERGQRANAPPAAAVGAAHFEEFLQAHFREQRGQMIRPVVDGRPFAGQCAQACRP